MPARVTAEVQGDGAEPGLEVAGAGRVVCAQPRGAPVSKMLTGVDEGVRCGVGIAFDAASDLEQQVGMALDKRGPRLLVAVGDPCNQGLELIARERGHASDATGTG